MTEASAASPHPNADALMAWGDHELTPDEAQSIDRHLGSCEQCRSQTRASRESRMSTRTWPVEPAPASLRSAVLAAAAAMKRPPNATSSPLGGRPFWRQMPWQIAAALFIVGVVFVGAQVTLCGTAFCYFQTPPSGSALPQTSGAAADSDNLALWWRSQANIDLGIPSEGARVVVVWFVDYECPSCLINDPTYTPFLERFEAEHSGVVKFVKRDWPWNAECNPNVPTISGHEASCAAAVAMKLAGERAAGDRMKAWLFSHQGGTTAAEVRSAARSIAGITDFDDRYPEEIRRLRAQLAPLHIPATPSCYVNGKRADAGGRLLSIENLKKVLEMEIAR